MSTFSPYTDELTGALVAMAYCHHEIHSGHHWTFAHTLAIAGGATENIRFTTPVDRYCHFFYEIAVDNPVDVTFSEDADLGALGGAISLWNRNRAVPFVTNALANAGCALGAGGVGTVLDDINVIGNNKASGGARQDCEWVLLPNEDYLFQFVAPAGPNVAGWLYVNWYEEINDVST